MTKIVKGISFFLLIIAIALAYTAKFLGWLETPNLLAEWTDWLFIHQYDIHSALPYFYVAVAFFTITKMVFVSYRLGSSTVIARQQLLLPVNYSAQLAEPHAPQVEEYEQIRERHQYELLQHEQIVLNVVKDYIFAVMAPYMSKPDIITLCSDIEAWLTSKDAQLSPVVTNGQLTTLDLRHLAWNIGERFKWTGEQRAVFIKNVFPHELRDSDISTIRRNLRQQGNCTIKIDKPESGGYLFHLGCPNGE